MHLRAGVRPKSELLPANSMPLSAVIVDDEQLARDELAYLLNHADVNVVAQGKNGLEAINLVREHNPDLPVIYTTGFSPVAPRPVAGSMLLQKPYHPQDIVKAVKQVTEPPTHEDQRRQ